MNKKIIVYTALFGDYGGLIEQPKLKNVDYICYTDRKDLKSKSWKIIQVLQPVKGDATRSNRYFKILAHKHLPSEYSISIYIDANILIFKKFLDLVFDKMSVAKMAYFDHMQTTRDPRDCIYEEHQAILDIAEKYNVIKGDPEIMDRQMKRFRKEGYPEHNGLISAAILIRKHFDQEIINLMEKWWSIVLNESKRDQLSFNYATWKLNFKNFSIIEGDIREGNPWFYLITHRKKYKYKVFRVKLNRFFRLK